MRPVSVDLAQIPFPPFQLPVSIPLETSIAVIYIHIYIYISSQYTRNKYPVLSLEEGKCDFQYLMHELFYFLQGRIKPKLSHF